MSRRTISGAGLVAFPAALWLLGCFFFLGDLGRYSDDYSIAMRDVSTGALDWSAHPWVRWPYFWRPLHLALIHALAAAFHHQFWIVHLVSAAAHGAGALALHRFLRVMGVGWAGAASAGLLLLAFPFAYEVVFWPATVSTSIATIILFGIWTWIARTARGERRARAWTDPPLLFAWAFAVPCFYEPSAAGLALIPLVWFAAAPPCARLSIAARWRTPLILTAAAGGACAMYVALLAATAPAWQRGSARNMTPTADLPERAAWIARHAADALVGDRARQHFLGALENAWTLRGSPALLALALIVAVAGAAWVHAARRRTREDTGPARGRTQSAALVLLGPALLLVCWLPVIAVQNTFVESRLLWVPFCGVAILLGVAIDALARGRPRALAPALVVVAVAAGVGATALLGCQKAFRDRAVFDEQTAAQLRALVPEPPAGTVFMPVRNLRPAAETGFPRFNWAVDAGLSQPWSAWAWLRWEYRRTDISATHLFSNEWPPLEDADSGGVTYTSPLPGMFDHRPRGRTRINWDRAVPFVIDRDGRVALVRTLTILHPGREPVVVQPPLVMPSDRRRRSATLELR